MEAMSIWLILIVVFFAIFTQSIAGFGMTLVAMPILGIYYDLKIISPLIALVGIVAKIMLLLKYGYVFNFQVMWRLTLASLIFVPLGVGALDLMDKKLALGVLGVIVLGYAVYSLLNSSVHLKIHEYWAFFFGAIAGFLGGAFNASGPPVVVYASAHRWQPEEFKSNLQGYALVNGIFIAVNHHLRGNIDAELWRIFLYTIPVALLGVWVGVSLDRYINPELFRKIILWLLIILGARLILA
jgi:uncharacterized membrane protein YfcA